MSRMTIGAMLRDDAGLFGEAPALLGDTAELSHHLGGDSLRATQVINLLRDVLGWRTPVQTLFRFPTPALLARELKSLERSDVDAIAGELERLSPEERASVLADL